MERGRGEWTSEIEKERGTGERGRTGGRALACTKGRTRGRAGGRTGVTAKGRSEGRMWDKERKSAKKMRKSAIDWVSEGKK